MDRLSALLQWFAQEGAAQAWLGPRPEGDGLSLLGRIASQIGYPTAEYDPFATGGGLIEVDRAEAAAILAFAATRSLAYDAGRGPPEGERRWALEAFEDLGREAVFYTNGHWASNLPTSWTPLSAATFDAGVIGFDNVNAFVFWVEDED